MIRVGFPGWKLAARLGLRVVFRINVIHDDEAGVYVATSPDLQGLVAEAKSMDELFAAVYDCVGMLMQDELKSVPKFKPFAAWTGELQPA
ncbi:putative RNase H-like HicB family nuclease [Pseudacidovorax sp. 1753]|uniref:DUF1902 domain-containing protein n=1 Tax=Pseudacidovorax sp. 1753 TaxID=3156419 RepID=UPI003392A71A